MKCFSIIDLEVKNRLQNPKLLHILFVADQAKGINRKVHQSLSKFSVTECLKDWNN